MIDSVQLERLNIEDTSFAKYLHKFNMCLIKIATLFSEKQLYLFILEFTSNSKSLLLSNKTLIFFKVILKSTSNDGMSLLKCSHDSVWLKRQFFTTANETRLSHHLVFTSMPCTHTHTQCSNPFPSWRRQNNGSPKMSIPGTCDYVWSRDKREQRLQLKLRLLNCPLPKISYLNQPADTPLNSYIEFRPICNYIFYLFACHNLSSLLSSTQTRFLFFLLPPTLPGPHTVFKLYKKPE